MKNSCKITFEGLNIGRILSSLTKQDIDIRDVQRCGKTCTIQVPVVRSKQTIAILRDKCYNILGVEFVGLSKAGAFLHKHAALPVICILLVLILVISSQICLGIKVTGDFDEQKVFSALQGLGVKVGSDLHKLNIGDIQNNLANELDAMYAVINRRGSVLYVNIVAGKEIAPPIDLSERRDIVATHSGVVANIVCEQGTPLVKVGDVVHQGDVLIEGRRVFNDGSCEEVYALGKVRLSVSVQGFARFDGVKYVDVETGNVFKSCGVLLFGKEYSKACPFERYVLNSTSSKLFPLGLEIRNNVYRETERKAVPATIEECIEELKSCAYKNAVAACNFEILDAVYNVQTDGVTATLCGEIQIE